MEHSKVFGFSSAHRWAFCSGAPKLCADIPDVPDESAEEGTAAHWVAEQMLQTFKLGANGLPIGEMLIAKKAPNGVIVTEEMVDGAIVYYKAVVAVVGNDRENLHIEVRVHAHHTLDPQAWGWADAIYYDVKTNTLYIWDFKFGFRSVPAFDNFQLAGYAIAAGETFNYRKINPRLNLTIVQPRAAYHGDGPIQHWITVYDDLRAHENIMKSAIIKYRMNDGRLVTGDWCRDCRGRHLCPSLADTVAKVIDSSKRVAVLDPTDEAIGYELDIIEMAERRIKERKTALEAEAEARVRKGRVVPGRAMKETIGNRAWNHPDSHIYALGELYKVDFKKPTQPVSPKQAEDILARKGVDADVIKPYYHKPKTGVKLVKDDGSKAKQIFSQEKLWTRNT